LFLSLDAIIGFISQCLFNVQWVLLVFSVFGGSFCVFSQAM
jgi:hypothetical protein